MTDGQKLLGKMKIHKRSPSKAAGGSFAFLHSSGIARAQQILLQLWDHDTTSMKETKAHEVCEIKKLIQNSDHKREDENGRWMTRPKTKTENSTHKIPF